MIIDFGPWIPAIGLIVPAVIAAYASTYAARRGIRNSHKLDEIHLLVNSNLTQVRDELAIARLQINQLLIRLDASVPKSELAQLATPLPGDATRHGD